MDNNEGANLPHWWFGHNASAGKSLDILIGGERSSREVSVVGFLGNCNVSTFCEIGSGGFCKIIDKTLHFYVIGVTVWFKLCQRDLYKYI